MSKHQHKNITATAPFKDALFPELCFGFYPIPYSTNNWITTLAHQKDLQKIYIIIDLPRVLSG